MKTLRVMWAACVMIVCWAGAAFAGPSGPVEVRRYALIVGANDGGSERVMLRYAGTDARAMSRVLEQLGGIPRGEQILVMDPSVGEVEKAFEELGVRIGRERAKVKRAEVLVYYSGHSDEQGLLLKGERMSYSSLRAGLDALPAQVRVVVLDSCSSGAMTREKGGARVASFLDDDSVQVEGQAILTSSSADEVAQESDTLGGSFFTHALIAGLRGAADVTGDRRVTLNEAYQFAFQETLERTEKTRGGAQHAAYDIHLTGQGDLVLTDLAQTSATMELGKSLAGRVSVRGEKGELAIELKKVGGRALELALPAQTYEVRWVRGDGSLMIASVEVVRGSRVQVKASEFGVASREDAVARGGTMRSGRGDPMPAGMDLFPFVGTSSWGIDRPRWFSFNIAGGISGGIRALEIGAGVNIANGSVRGLQIAGASNVVTEGVMGLQVAGGFNMAMSRLDGAQVGATNLAMGGVRGLQVGGINATRGSVLGGQLGAVNAMVGEVVGGQLGGVNVLVGDVVGGQLGAVNMTTGLVKGLQLGAINVGGPTKGLQFGAVNVSTGEVEGFQFGVINVAEKASGSFGVLNFFWDGETHVDAWGTEVAGVHAGVRHGSGATYNVYSVGTNLLGDTRVLMGGLGIGYQRELTANFSLNIDATGHLIMLPERSFRPGGSINKIRLMATFSPTDWFTVFGGPTANTMLSECEYICEDFIPFGSFEATDPDSDFKVFLWPGLVLGARL